MIEVYTNWLKALKERWLLRVHLMMQIICTVQLFGAQYAYGATTELTPRIILGQIYTDNLELDNEEEKSKFITQATPGFNASLAGARITADLDYELQAFFYGSENSTAHQLDGSGNAELYREMFFVDADVNVFQSVIDPEGTTALDNVNRSDNRTNVLTANLSPYWQYRFSGSTEALARYRYGIVNYDESDDDNNVEDSTIQAVSLSLGNLLDASRQWTWRLSYDNTRIAYDDDDTDTLRSAQVTLGYRLSSKLQLLADVGDDDNDFESENRDDTSGFFWNTGIRWDPNSKSHLEAGFGQRYDGNVYNFLFVRKARNATMEVSYSQTLDSDSNVLSEDEVPVGSDNAIGFRSDATIFERKLFRASSTINWSKSIIEFILSNERRESQDTGVEDEYTSFSGDWVWRFGSRTSMKLGIFASRQDFGDTDQEQDIGRLSVGLNRQLGPKTQGTIEYSHSRQDSDDETNEYQENRVWFSLAREF